jgi:hypothetical protein
MPGARRRLAGGEHLELEAHQLPERPRLEGAAAGRCGGSPSAISADVVEPVLVERAHERRQEPLGGLPPDLFPAPRTRTHASTNGPMSHVHTVPW